MRARGSTLQAPANRHVPAAAIVICLGTDWRKMPASERNGRIPSVDTEKAFEFSHGSPRVDSLRTDHTRYPFDFHQQISEAGPVVAKSRQQKKKEREKRVAKQKLADASRRRESGKKSEDAPSSGGLAARGSKVMTAGVRQKAQQQPAKPAIVHRRTGG